MKRLLSIAILGMLLPLFTMAQQNDGSAPEDSTNYGFEDYRSDKLKNLGTKKKLKIANSLYEKGSYINALMYYNEVYNEKPDNACVVSRLAKLNYLVRDYKQAEQWYKKFYDLDPEKYSKAKYMYALMLKYNGKCEEAKTNFQAFIDEYDDADDDMDKFKKKVENQIKGCDLQIQTVNDPERVTVDLLDTKVNNPFTDYAPVPTGKDEFVFSSLRSDSIILLPTEEQLESGEKDGTYNKSQLYTSKYTNGSWTEAKLFPTPVNDENEHIGNATFSADGKTMYFTRCRVGEELKMECKIFRSKLEGGAWGEPEELESLNESEEGSTTTHPAVGKTADGKPALYFTSDRENGKGGMDIWYAEIKDNGAFGPVKNLGDFNTEANEVTPFYDLTNDALYYSSDIDSAIGGYDVYQVLKAEGGNEWLAPVNMLAPINSPVDDIYFSISGDDKNGFITSNRPGGYGLKSETCCDDIYSFLIIREIILKGYVATEKDPETPIEGADVSIFIKNGEELNLIANFTTNAEEEFMVPLDPETVYQVNVTKSGYYGSEEVIDVASLDVKDTLEKIFYIQEIARRKIQLKRVYFAFDKYNLNRKYKASLDSLAQVLKDNPEWTVELYGHTDSIASEAYNMVLSKNRAQTAADYLVSLGIDISRISLIAKGETMPIAPNSTEKGNDNPKGRAKNRRVDYQIITNDNLLEIDIEYMDDGPSNYK